MQESRASSYLFGGNAPYVEELYEAYLDNPGSVPDKWRAYFDALQNVPAADGTSARDMAHAPVGRDHVSRRQWRNGNPCLRPSTRPACAPDLTVDLVTAAGCESITSWAELTSTVWA